MSINSEMELVLVKIFLDWIKNMIFLGTKRQSLLIIPMK